MIYPWTSFAVKREIGRRKPRQMGGLIYGSGSGPVCQAPQKVLKEVKSLFIFSKQPGEMFIKAKSLL